MRFHVKIQAAIQADTGPVNLGAQIPAELVFAVDAVDHKAALARCLSTLRAATGTSGGEWRGSISHPRVGWSAPTREDVEV